MNYNFFYFDDLWGWGDYLGTNAATNEYVTSGIVSYVSSTTPQKWSPISLTQKINSKIKIYKFFKYLLFFKYLILNKFKIRIKWVNNALYLEV